MLTFSKEDSSALATLTDTPGFKGDMVSSDIHAREVVLAARKLSGSYEPRNSITNGRLTVKVAGIEATGTEIVLKTAKNSKELLDEKELVRTTSSALPLSQVLSHSGTALESLLGHQQANTLRALSQLLLTESDESTTEHYTVADGKIVTEKTVITYNSEQESTLTQQTINLFNAHIAADKNLSASIFQTFDNQLLARYPLIKSEKPCKVISHTTANKLSDVILSRTYSSNPAATEELFKEALFTYGRYSFTSEIIKMLALCIAAGDDNPATQCDLHYNVDGVTYFVSRKESLRIAHCQNADELMHSKNNHSLPSSEIDGHYSSEFNVVTFLGNEADTFTPYFIHEASHAAMNFIFKNKTKPYCQSDINQKNAYEKAALTVFKNVARKLGATKTVLSTIDSISEIISMLKKHTILDLIEYRAAPARTKDVYFIAGLRSKYGFGEDISAAQLEERIRSKLDQEIARLRLNSHDITILIEFATLIYDYQEEEIEEELIVRLPQMQAERIPFAKLKSYLNPLMNYWNATIKPAVSTLFEIHQARSREASDKTTTYLIEEYLPRADSRKRRRS